MIGSRDRAGMEVTAGTAESPLVNPGIRICIDCGSSRVSLTHLCVQCRDCGAQHRRAAPHRLRFRRGDCVRMTDAAGADGDGMVYTVEGISKDRDGTIRYALTSPPRPIAPARAEGLESRLVQVGAGGAPGARPARSLN